MSSLTINSNPNSTSLSIPKLHDNGSNWVDYKPCIQKVMGSKGLWRHVKGTVTAPKLYALVNGSPILVDGNPATEEKIAKEACIIKYDK